MCNTTIRRWRVIIVDDDPRGSHGENEFRRIFYHPTTDGKVGADEAERFTALTRILPEYCPESENTSSWAALDDTQLEHRRVGGPPMLDVFRSFETAWAHFGRLKEQSAPPDIVFLDIDLKSGRINKSLPVEIRAQLPANIPDESILFAGGRYLHKRVLELFPAMLPLVVLFSAHPDAQAMVEGVEPKALVLGSEGGSAYVKGKFERRLASILSSGEIDGAKVNDALQMADEGRFGEALKVQVSSTGWLLGTLFPEQAKVLAKGGPLGKKRAIEQIRQWTQRMDLSEMLYRFWEESPLRLLAHKGRVARPWRHGSIDVWEGKDLFDAASNQAAAKAVACAMELGGGVVASHLATLLDSSFGVTLRRVRSQLEHGNSSDLDSLIAQTESLRRACRLEVRDVLSQVLALWPEARTEADQWDGAYVFLPKVRDQLGSLGMLLGALRQLGPPAIKLEDGRLAVDFELQKVFTGPPTGGGDLPQAMNSTLGWVRVRQLGSGGWMDLHSGYREGQGWDERPLVLQLSVPVFHSAQGH